MDIQKIIGYWVTGADKDWLACEHLYQNKDYPQCLFWGHLVLEKLLKALVVKNTNQQAPYSHDLVLLASKGAIRLTEKQRSELNEINAFNQFGRYDNEIMNFVEKCTPAFTEKYFLIFKDFYLWLKENFQKKS